MTRSGHWRALHPHERVEFSGCGSAGVRRGAVQNRAGLAGELPEAWRFELDRERNTAAHEPSKRN